jgi:hypothetical protein
MKTSLNLNCVLRILCARGSRVFRFLGRMGRDLRRDELSKEGYFYNYSEDTPSSGCMISRIIVK